MSAPKPSIVESAQEFIDDTESLLEKEGYELGDEPCDDELYSLIAESSVIRSTVMKDGYYMECMWWCARDPWEWRHQVDLIIFRDAPIEHMRVAELSNVKTPQKVVEFLLEHCPGRPGKASMW